MRKKRRNAEGNCSGRTAALAMNRRGPSRVPFGGWVFPRMREARDVSFTVRARSCHRQPDCRGSRPEDPHHPHDADSGREWGWLRRRRHRRSMQRICRLCKAPSRHQRRPTRQGTPLMQRGLRLCSAIDSDAPMAVPQEAPQSGAMLLTNQLVGRIHIGNLRAARRTCHLGTAGYGNRWSVGVSASDRKVYALFG